MKKIFYVLLCSLGFSLATFAMEDGTLTLEQKTLFTIPFLEKKDGGVLAYCRYGVDVRNYISNIKSEAKQQELLALSNKNELQTLASETVKKLEEKKSSHQNHKKNALCRGSGAVTLLLALDLTEPIENYYANIAAYLFCGSLLFKASCDWTTQFYQYRDTRRLLEAYKEFVQNRLVEEKKKAE